MVPRSSTATVGLGEFDGRGVGNLLGRADSLTWTGATVAGAGAGRTAIGRTTAVATARPAATGTPSQSQRAPRRRCGSRWAAAIRDQVRATDSALGSAAAPARSVITSRTATNSGSVRFTALLPDGDGRRGERAAWSGRGAGTPAPPGAGCGGRRRSRRSRARPPRTAAARRVAGPAAGPGPPRSGAGRP